MKHNNKIPWSLCALAGAGFLVPFWPLCALSVILAAWFNQTFLALLLGILLDIAYGTPTGVMRFMLFPFTVVALFAALTRAGVVRYLLSKTPPGKI